MNLKNLKLGESVIYGLAIKDETGHVVEVWDDFLVGHCHEFAIALNKVFNYRIGVIKGVTYAKNGEHDKRHLLHAFGISPSGRAYDVNGLYDVEKHLRNYKKAVNPETGSVVDKVSYNIYSDINKFKKKLWTIPVNNSYIIRAIKRITAKPLEYFDSRSIREVTPLQMPFVLETNKKWEWGSDEQYSYFLNNRLNEKFALKVKKGFGIINGMWIVTEARTKWQGFIIALGIGTLDFSLVRIETKIKTKINENLSDEQSKMNYDKLFSYAEDFLTSNTVKEYFKKIIRLK